MKRVLPFVFGVTVLTVLVLVTNQDPWRSDANDICAEMFAIPEDILENDAARDRYVEKYFEPERLEPVLDDMGKRMETASSALAELPVPVKERPIFDRMVGLFRKAASEYRRHDGSQGDETLTEAWITADELGLTHCS